MSIKTLPNRLEAYFGKSMLKELYRPGGYYRPDPVYQQEIEAWHLRENPPGSILEEVLWEKLRDQETGKGRTVASLKAEIEQLEDLLRMARRDRDDMRHRNAELCDEVDSLKRRNEEKRTETLELTGTVNTQRVDLAEVRRRLGESIEPTSENVKALEIGRSVLGRMKELEQIEREEEMGARFAAVVDEEVS